MKSPPCLAPARWNSIYLCCQYINNNYDSIASIIEMFKNSKWQSPTILDQDKKTKIVALYRALEPLDKFTNNVQKNFVSAGDVYFHLNKLQIEMSTIFDQYNFAADIFSNNFTRFTETCDSTLALLCFILTKEGRIRWKEQKEKADEEARILMNSWNRQAQPSNLLIWYNNEKAKVFKKLDELSSFFKLNSEMVTKAFNI